MSISSSPLPSSPSSTTTSEKNRRYDRQLRLWGDHGQRSLETSHVLVVGANVTTCETLKSLVLPGIGAFTLVDPKQVSHEDVGGNFFLSAEHVGRMRGKVATELLLEMNGEVRGEFVEESFDRLLETRPEFLSAFSLVIASSEVSERSLKRASELLWAANVPLMVVKACGFIGCIRQQIKEHPVLESHPDNHLDDFRLDVPFRGLIEYMNAMNLDTMTKQEHSHTPYLVILYKFLQRWKDQHGGKAPSTYPEKRQFKEFLLDGRLKNADGIPEDEENFDEAAAAVNTALAPTCIPDHVRAIMNDERCVDIGPNSNNFWIIMRGIKEFVEEEDRGHLPCNGIIPDMFSDSERYIALQNVYREKAAEDVETVMRHVRNHLELIGRSPESISETSVKLICKEAYNVRLVGCAGESIAHEYSGKSPHSAATARLFDSDPETAALYYFILRGVDRFYSEYNAVPGGCDDLVEPDIGKLKTCVQKVMSEYGLPQPNLACKDDFIHEVCRYGGAEIHSIAAIVGGCAAHEAIKLITGQYVPVDNLFVYTALTSETVTLKV